MLTVLRLALAKDLKVRSTARTKDWFVAALALASLLVYLRTLFRLSETAQGLFASISTNETFFGTLEFAPVVIAIWIMAVWHPGRWLPNGIDAENPISHTATVEASSDKENVRPDV